MYRFHIYLTLIFFSFFLYHLQPYSLVSSTVSTKSYKELLQMVMDMEKAYAKVKDYSTIFIKQERGDGEKKMWEKETIHVYFKKPFNVYMKWIEEPNKGNQVIFRKGHNDDKLLAKAKVLWTKQTLSLDPEGSLAMKENRHPITQMGLGFLMETLIKNVKRADENKELKIVYRGEKKMLKRDVYLVEGIMPKDKGKKYYCYRAVLAIDKQNGLPIQFEGYMWDDQLYESYSYTDLKINMGLEDKFFESFKD